MQSVLFLPGPVQCLARRAHHTENRIVQQGDLTVRVTDVPQPVAHLRQSLSENLWRGVTVVPKNCGDFVIEFQHGLMVHGAPLVMPPIAQKVVLQAVPQDFFTLGTPALRVAAVEKESGEQQRATVFQQVVVEQIVFQMVFQKRRLHVQAAAQFGCQSFIFFKGGSEQRIGSDPVGQPQRSGIRVPRGRRCDGTCGDPLPHQIPEHLVSLLVTFMRKGGTESCRVVPSVEVVEPEADLVIGGPTDRPSELDRMIQKREFSGSQSRNVHGNAPDFGKLKGMVVIRGSGTAEIRCPVAADRTRETLPQYGFQAITNLLRSEVGSSYGIPCQPFQHVRTRRLAFWPGAGGITGHTGFVTRRKRTGTRPCGRSQGLMLVAAVPRSVILGNVPVRRFGLPEAGCVLHVVVSQRKGAGVGSRLQRSPAMATTLKMSQVCLVCSQLCPICPTSQTANRASQNHLSGCGIRIT